jgi:DNA (cytosine-5)-methyltransferase 1
MLLPDEITVDNFAGGGGVSTGIGAGINGHVDIAINHDPDAIDIGVFQDSCRLNC